MNRDLTAKRSRFEGAYFLIMLNGRAWRVCHESHLAARWPDITIIEERAA